MRPILYLPMKSKALNKPKVIYCYLLGLYSFRPVNYFFMLPSLFAFEWFFEFLFISERKFYSCIHYDFFICFVNMKCYIHP
ncbi:hypothetical protein HDF25_003170 [Pedobacter cryoconitis]|uniref:Uncharacterized protein n=1 Tax=Pedobacter cryoconitis TaxID=188932 RepID=A0A7X0J611_9SPHI|nr:hypothetical protein [Pedobacter cryoconitis]